MVHSPRLRVIFYRSARGREPVREWLRSLDKTSRRVIAEDIKTVQIGWPLGMPLARPMGGGLWDIRSRVRSRQFRTVFSVEDGLMVLLHGFAKKSRAIPRREIDLCRRRAREMKSG